MTYRIGSLCTGYGGLDMAVEAALGGELAWVADIDPGATAILAHRFPLVPNLGDITATDWAAVEPVDILCAGFPCQDISCAGQRAGLREGTRSGLWFHVARAIAALRPPLVVIENVKELLSAPADSDLEPCPWCLGDPGAESAMRALGAVLADLAEIGFDAEWVSVPAAAAGACHLRWRVFILAWPAADADSARRREVAGSASGDEGPDARWPAADDHVAIGAGTQWPPAAGWGSIADAAGHQPRRDDTVAGNPGREAGDGPGPGHRLSAADPAGIGTGEPADEADAIPGGRRAWPVPGGRGAGTPADTERHGRPGRRPGGPGEPHAPGAGSWPATARPGPGAAADAERGGRDGGAPQPERGPVGGVASPWDRPGAFGRYEAAVRRHERVFGRRAPSPVEPGPKGDPRLSPRFVEWLMGLPAGWVTDVPGLSRNAQLKALGNGVVPQQAEMALRLLLPALEREASAA